MSVLQTVGQRLLMLVLLVLVGCETLPDAPLQPPVLFAYEAYCAQVGEGISNNETGHQPASEVAEPPDHDAEAVARYVLKTSALAVAAAAADSESCERTFSRGEQIFKEILAGQQSAMKNLGGYKQSGDESIAKVQKAITLMWQNDQSARGTYIALQTEDKQGAEFWAERRAAAHTRLLDGRSANFIESLLSQYQWIDRDQFGDEVSAHAWILVQHADHLPDLQRRVLSRMEPLLATNGVSRKNYAFLWDRVAVNSDRAQRYGTQPTWECEDGKMALKPLEDPDNVNARRAQMGLNSVEQGLADMTAQYCGSSF